MNEFQAVVHSLGEHVVDSIGREHILEVTVHGDELNGSAEVSIGLSDWSWAEQERAIDRMVEIRAMFLDELSFSYHFIEPSEGASRKSSKTAELVFA